MNAFPKSNKGEGPLWGWCWTHLKYFIRKTDVGACWAGRLISFSQLYWQWSGPSQSSKAHYPSIVRETQQFTTLLSIHYVIVMATAKALNYKCISTDTCLIVPLFLFTQLQRNYIWFHFRQSKKQKITQYKMLISSLSDDRFWNYSPKWPPSLTVACDSSLCQWQKTVEGFPFTVEHSELLKREYQLQNKIDIHILFAAHKGLSVGRFPEQHYFYQYLLCTGL